MTTKSYLVKNIKVNTTDDEIIIQKILNKTPSFNTNNEKIISLFQISNGENLNEDLCGELTMDKYTWGDILNNLDDDYTSEDLAIIETITKDIEDNDLIHYECF